MKISRNNTKGFVVGTGTLNLTSNKKNHFWKPPYRIWKGGFLEMLVEGLGFRFRIQFYYKRCFSTGMD